MKAALVAVAWLAIGAVESAAAYDLPAPPHLVVEPSSKSHLSERVELGQPVLSLPAHHARIGVLRNEGIRQAPFVKLRWLPAGTPVFYTEMRTTVVQGNTTLASIISPAWCGVVAGAEKPKGYCMLLRQQLIGGVRGTDTPYYPSGLGGAGGWAEPPVIEEGVGDLPGLTLAYRFAGWSDNGPKLATFVVGPSGETELGTVTVQASADGRWRANGFGAEILFERSDRENAVLVALTSSP